jgi:hypothetical protein
MLFPATEMLFLMLIGVSNKLKLIGATSRSHSSVVSLFHVSSHLVNLDKVSFNDTKEKVRTWCYYKQQHNNIDSIQGRKNSNHSDNSISYPAYRLRSLLALYKSDELHNLCRLWKYHYPQTSFDDLQGGTRMSASCWRCGNRIVFDDNILSKNGKHKPLNEWNHQIRDCEFSPFNKSKESAQERKAIQKLEEFQVIEELRNQVATINNRLWNYEIQIIVRSKEF